MAFVIRRTGQAALTLFVISFLAFASIHLVPGDPVMLALDTHATPEQVNHLRQLWGLNDPFYIQYFSYISRALVGDFGISIRSQQPVLEEIALRVPSTLQLAAFSAVLAIAIGLAAGIIAGRSRRAVDVGVMAVTLVGLSMPTFWSGIILILVFGLSLKWVPVFGSDSFQALILPSIALALPFAAILARVTRSSIIETASRDFVRTARAKGLSSIRVTARHILPNALMPIVTFVGLHIGGLLSGTVVVETLFARPGIGRLAVQAISERDFPTIQGVILLSGILFVAINLTTDMTYALIDPRVRL